MWYVLPKAKSGSMVLRHLGSMLRSIASVVTRGYRKHVCWNLRAMLSHPTIHRSWDSRHCSLLDIAAGEMVPWGLGELALWHELRSASSSPRLRWVVSLAQTNLLSYCPDSHPRPSADRFNIYPIYDLLYRIKGLIFQNDSHRNPMTQGNRRISKRRFGEGPVMMVC